MSTKTCVWLGFFLGSVIGGFIPAFFGYSLLSFTSILGNTIGGIIGIIIDYKLGVNS